MISPASRSSGSRASRLKPKHWFAGVALAIGLAGAPATLDLVSDTTVPAAADELTDEARYIEAINEIRSDAGLEPLTSHPELTEQARDWSIQLRSNDQLSHAEDLSIGITGNWTKLGENVGVGPDDQLAEIFDAFVASPAHFANLMDPDFRFVGVGVVYDEQGRMWTTHRFMTVAPNDDAVVAATDSTTLEPAAPDVLAAPEAEAPEVLALNDTEVAAPDDGPPAAVAIEEVLLADLFGQLANEGF